MFDKLASLAERYPIRGWIVPKLSEYGKVEKASEILGVSQGTVWDWAAYGELPMHRNPANEYRLFKRSDLDAFLKKTARPIKVTK
jgi:excisionase family DNA binding protein